MDRNLLPCRSLIQNDSALSVRHQCELLGVNRSQLNRTPRDLRIAVREYIRKYNEERPHAALDNAVPDAVYASGFVA